MKVARGHGDVSSVSKLLGYQDDNDFLILFCDVPLGNLIDAFSCVEGSLSIIFRFFESAISPDSCDFFAIDSEVFHSVILKAFHIFLRTYFLLKIIQCFLFNAHEWFLTLSFIKQRPFEGQGEILIRAQSQQRPRFMVPYAFILRERYIVGAVQRKTNSPDNKKKVHTVHYQTFWLTQGIAL